MKNFLKRIDPLVWFVCLGGAIFAFDAGNRNASREVIEVTPEMATRIVSNQEAIAGVALSPERAAALLARYADEEILAREAVARGLHLGDGKVRARLIARMEFLLSTEAPAPTEADLETFRAQKPERYMTARRYSFEHRFFGADEQAADAAITSYRSGGRMPETGTEAFWLGQEMDAYASAQLLSVLGHKFLKALPDLPRGEWSGPVESRRGWHLVRLTDVIEPAPLPEDELLFRLMDDWRRKHRLQARENALAELRHAYEIRLPSEPDAGPGAASAGPAK